MQSKKDSTTVNGTNHTGTGMDPELHEDVDIYLPRSTYQSAKTRISQTSAKSRKSNQSLTDRSNVVKSRGRPMKPHETEPFLSIDNLPPEKSFVTEKTDGSRPTSNRGKLKSPGYVSQIQRMASYMSPYNQATPGPPSPSVVSGTISTHGARNVKSPGIKSRPSTSSRPQSKQNAKENINIDTPDGVFDNANKKDDHKNALDVDLENSTTSKTEVIRNSRPNTASRPFLEHDEGVEEKRKKLNSVSRPTTGGSVRSRGRGGVRDGSGSRRDARAANKSGRPHRSVPSRNGRITPANTPFQSPNKQLRTPNHHIKSPFKHAVNKPDMVLEGRETPSMGLKERTSLAAYHVTKIMSLAADKDSAKIPGKLQKGKLKPLYPVHVQGPKITQCRGIVSDAKDYEASQSRTLQRRIQLINTIPNVHDYLYDRPRTVESVHQTSVASSIDDYGGYEENLDSNRSLPDEIIYAEQKSELYLEPMAPENTFVPVPVQDGSGQIHLTTDITPRMFATEVAQADLDNPDLRGVDLSTRLQHELYVGAPGQNESQQNNNNNNSINGSRMAKEEITGSGEMAAGKVNEGGKSGNPQNNRSNSRIGSSKSVRFLDSESKTESGSSKELKQIANTNIAKQQREKPENADGESHQEASVKNDVKDSAKTNKKSKDSCKDDLHDGNRSKKDDDSDDERKGKDDSNKKENSITENKSVNSSKTADNSNSNSNGETENGGGNNNSGKKDCAEIDSLTTGESVDRCKSPTHSSRNRNSKSRKSGSKPGTPKSSNCAKFSQSSASLAHTHALQVSGVIHGDSYQTILQPESPPRRQHSSRHHPNNPDTKADKHADTGEEFQFFSKKSKPCFEVEEGNFWSNMFAQRSKVKFMLDGEAPEVETIFIEDGDDVDLRRDKPLTFDAIDSELENMRHAIQSTLQRESETNHEMEEVDDEQTDTEEPENNPQQDTEGQTVEAEAVETKNISEDVKEDTTELVDIESVRGEYSKLLDKYRQRCMDKYESYGALSGKLVTPRIPERGTSSKAGGSHLVQQPSVAGSDMFKLDDTQKVGLCSDSGRGSVDNLSEWSKSQGQSDVPRLDLGGSTSDLGLDTGRSDVTLTEGPDDSESEKPLLEMVCDELSPMAKKKESAEDRKELEEDTSKLKVVATTKSLSKPKQQKTTPTLKPQLPPLCFTINARPPAGHLYYFAYGPEMNPNRFGSYIRREITQRYWGLLFGFSLVFNKKGTSEEAGGFANIEFNPLRSVEGVLYTITQEELAVLDKCVGYPQHYEHLMLPVWLSNSKEPDAVGVAQYCVPALMYIAQNEWTETEKTLPCDYALSQCIKSADLLTPDYKTSLVTMATQEVKAAA